MFASKFRTVEDPLLHSLHYWYRLEIPLGQIHVVDAAYSSYGRILRSFPPRLRHLIWECRSSHSADPPLPYLHPVDISQVDLDALDRCCRMLRNAHTRGPAHPLGGILEEIGGGIDLADGFSRVLRVLRLTAPPALLATSLGAASRGAESPVALDRTTRREHLLYCTEVIRELSDGDEFQHLAHQALYRAVVSATY
ncbi:hypothetical protein ACFWVC_07475 [Streptomyces sp. NPDC058691]|uniref:hypothetical protein n=1 Tax=Streptomyces sp. NPDC058691 TaxID=3346601 RepID=UPI00365281EC